MLRLHPSTVDYAILAIYFAVVLGIGFVARLAIKTDLDFFLSGRSLPAWITGLAFIAANLGALEILGQAANGAQYGVAAVHYYWIAAVLVLVYITLGGLTSAIYNEVLQFFVIVAALLPLTLVALNAVGGVNGLMNRVKAYKPLGDAGLHAWRGLGIHHVTNPLASDWVGIVFGLGFVLSFGYWTTNF